MSAYTVETRSQGAIILTSSPELGDALSAAFRAISVDPLQLDFSPGLDSGACRSAVAKYLESSDLDYVVVVLTPALTSWLLHDGAALWQDLLTLGEGSSFLLATRPWDPPDAALDLPVKVRHVVLGEYLDRAGEGTATLDTLLTEALKNSVISLPGDGVVDYSLLSLADLSSALVHAVTAPGRVSGHLTLANPETLSLLSLAHTIAARVGKAVKITFHRPTPLRHFSYNWEKILLLHARYGIVVSGKISESLETYLRSFRPPRGTSAPAHPKSPPVLATKEIAPAHSLAKPRLTPLQELVTNSSSNHKDSRPKPSLVFVPLHAPKLKLSWPKLKGNSHSLGHVIFRGLGIGLALYLGTLAFSGTLVALHLRSLKNTLVSGSYSKLKLSPLTKLAGLYLDANTVALSSLPILNNISQLQDARLLLDLYTQGLTVLGTAEGLADSAKSISTYVLTDQGGDVAAHFSTARLFSEELYERLSLLDGSMPTDPPALIKKYGESYAALKSSPALLKKNLVTGKALLAAGPDLIALGTRAKYAVLFQNNMELRATGGFIGSFAILSFENGRLYDLAVYDVYSADGQLKGHVEPPAPIKDILGEANWYLRDSNFDPDFPTSARRAEWFIKKTLNIDVNGTIGVTLDLLRALLKATGPLDLPDYQETVTEGNIYERAQFHSEVNFFPGSAAKKEFLSSVADALFAKVRTGEGIDTLKLVSALSSAVDTKNIVVSVLDPEVEHVFRTLSWNGQLADHPCPGGAACTEDYLFLVDSNFGVNKANYYVSRDLALTVNVGKEGTLSHVFKASYRNSATSTAWPAGPYKNYARLYLPFGSNLESLTVGGTPLAPADYALTEEHGKLVVAFLLTVPVNSSLTVEARYTTPAVLRAGSLYTWYWQKQPGTLASEPLAVTLNYPLYLKPAVISPAGTMTPQQLRFDFRNDTDHRVTVKFSE